MITCSEAGYLKGHRMQNQHVSEVARLKWQIAAEQESAQRALSSLAYGSAQHRFITRRMERMGDLTVSLAKLEGEKEAGKFLKGLN